MLYSSSQFCHLDHNTFDYNHGIGNDFAKHLKECCNVGSVLIDISPSNIFPTFA